MTPCSPPSSPVRRRLRPRPPAPPSWSTPPVFAPIKASRPAPTPPRSAHFPQTSMACSSTEPPAKSSSPPPRRSTSSCRRPWHPAPRPSPAPNRSLTGATGEFTVTSPGIGLFSLSADPSQPGAILNQDSSVNTAASPAAQGSVVQIFGTGFAQATQVMFNDTPPRLNTAAPSPASPDFGRSTPPCPLG